MKKFNLIITTFLTVISFTLSAQIYIGDNIHDGTNKRSYSILTGESERDLTQTLEKFLNQYGKIEKPEKNIYRISKPKNTNVSSDLSYIDVVSKSTKSMSKLEFFFLNDAHNALNDFELNENGAENFTDSFISYWQNTREKELIEENVSLAEGELKTAQKNQARIRRAIESNLKAQQKLGKQLDVSPELMAEAMSEKDEINTLLSDENIEDLDDKTISKLNRESQRKEKQITKISKKAKKAEKDLEKREEELKVLKREMAEVRALVNACQKALIDAQSFSKN